MQQKKVTIISLDFVAKDGTKWEKGLVHRVTAELAYVLISQGSHRQTTKSKLKSFLNQQRRLTRNMDTFDRIKAKGYTLQPFKLKEEGKVYMPLPYSKKKEMEPVGHIQYKSGSQNQFLVADFNS